MGNKRKYRRDIYQKYALSIDGKTKKQGNGPVSFELLYMLTLLSEKR